MATRVETWTARLVKHASNGTALDLVPASGELLLPDPDMKWSTSRTIPAEAIVAAMTQTQVPLHRFGLRVSGALISGPIDLRLSKLTAGLELRGCSAPDGIAVSDATMPWMRLVDCTLSDIQAERLQMSGNLMAHGCWIRNPNGVAVALDGAHVNDVFLDRELRAEGQVRALGATFAGMLSLRSAVLDAGGATAVVLDGATITRGAFLDREFESTGEVRGLGVTVTGQLSLRGARIRNADGDALSLDRARIDGDLFLDEGFEATGTVRLPGATITGMLSLRGAKLDTPGREALNLDRAEIAGTVFLDHGFEAHGEVRALAASIVGQVSLSGSKLDNPSGDALSLDGATVGRGIYLDRGFEARGVVRALGATVRGQLSIRDATIDHPTGVALNLEGVTVTGGTTLHLGLRGTVSIREALLGERTVIEQIVPQSGRSSGIDLAASGATLDWLDMRLDRESQSTVDLSYATIRRLDIDPLRSLALDGAVGWSLGALHGELVTQHREVVRMLKKLPRGGSGGFVPQPWKELADAIERAGEPSQARRLRWQAARQTTRTTPFLARAFVRIPYGLVVGYGYYPLLTIAWIVALWLAMLVLTISFRDLFVPTDVALAHALNTTSSPVAAASLLDGYPPLNPALYALDVALPAAATGQSASWRLEDGAGLVSVFAVAKAISWALTALLVAGITGILRKD